MWILYSRLEVHCLSTLVQVCWLNVISFCFLFIEATCFRMEQCKGASQDVDETECVVPECPFRVEDDFCDKHGRGQ